MSEELKPGTNQGGETPGMRDAIERNVQQLTGKGLGYKGYSEKRAREITMRQVRKFERRGT